MSLIVPGRIEQEGEPESERGMSEGWNVSVDGVGENSGGNGSAGVESAGAVGENSGWDAGAMPGRICGIAASAPKGEDAMQALSRLNRYNEVLSGLSSGFANSSGAAEDTAALTSGWQEYVGRLETLSGDYLREERNPAAAGYFRRNMSEQLERQRRLYTAKLRDSMEREQLREVSRTTDNALGLLATGVPEKEYLSRHVEEAFNQACEEAILTGVEREEEIAAYAGRRIVPAVEQVVNGCTGTGEFAEAQEYLAAVADYLPEKDRTELLVSVREGESLQRAREYALAKDNEGYAQYVAGLPERVRSLAEVDKKWRRRREFEEERSLRLRALNQAAESLERTGMLLPYVSVDGRRIWLEAGDYEEILYREQAEAEKRERSSESGEDDSGEEG